MTWKFPYENLNVGFFPKHKQKPKLLDELSVVVVFLILIE